MLEQRHLDIYRGLFVNRDDVYAQQNNKGSYFLKRSPVSDQVLRAHLEGGITAGWYALAQDNTIRWVALDADSEDGLEKLQGVWKQLEHQGISSLLESSRRGGHLWVLFEPTQARAARRVVLGPLPQLAGVEVYPKQDSLDLHSKVGSLMRGPLGIHRKTGKRYPFLDPISLNPISRSVVGTIEYLAGAQSISVDQVAEQLATLPPAGDPRPSLEPGPRAGRLSAMARLKQSLGDPYAFISRFVELDSSGKGHCPFHPPDHHPSFVVNRAGGYWIDFHEVNPRTGRYIGGDAIEFYRKLKGLTYQQVLRELRD